MFVIHRNYLNHISDYSFSFCIDGKQYEVRGKGVIPYKLMNQETRFNLLKFIPEKK